MGDLFAYEQSLPDNPSDGEVTKITKVCRLLKNNKIIENKKYVIKISIIIIFKFTYISIGQALKSIGK